MLFTKQPIGTKHYSEMTNQELRDELSKMLKYLISTNKNKDTYWVSDFIRGTNSVPCLCNNQQDIIRVSFPWSESDITIGLIKELQKEHNLKDTDEVLIAYNEDEDGVIDTVLSFKTQVSESDLEYYNRIKEMYLQDQEQDKVYRFIADLKKRTGTEMPYYQAKAAMEILESCKENTK